MLKTDLLESYFAALSNCLAMAWVMAFIFFILAHLACGEREHSQSQLSAELADLSRESVELMQKAEELATKIRRVSDDHTAKGSTVSMHIMENTGLQGPCKNRAECGESPMMFCAGCFDTRYVKSSSNTHSQDGGMGTSSQTGSGYVWVPLPVVEPMEGSILKNGEEWNNEYCEENNGKCQCVGYASLGQTCQPVVS